MTFQFRLSTVLKVREYERNLHRQSVSMARETHSQCLADCHCIASERTALLAELRELNDGDSMPEGWRVIGGGWRAELREPNDGKSLPLDKIALRQRHAEQLRLQLEMAEIAADDAARNLERCLKSLILANRSVQVLEHLAERQLAEFAKSEARAEAREFDDFVNGSRRAG